MLTVLRKLESRIPGHLPKAWVTGILLWSFAALLMLPAFLLLELGWDGAYMVVFGAIFLSALGGMGCVAWLVSERNSGQVTPWRR